MVAFSVTPLFLSITYIQNRIIGIFFCLFRGKRQKTCSDEGVGINVEHSITPKHTVFVLQLPFSVHFDIPQCFKQKDAIVKAMVKDEAKGGEGSYKRRKVQRTVIILRGLERRQEKTHYFFFLWRSLLILSPPFRLVTTGHQFRDIQFKNSKKKYMEREKEGIEL